MFLINFTSILYLSTVFVFWLLLSVAGYHWWPATLFLFGPRWLIALPLIIFLPLAAFYNRRIILLSVAALLIIIFPIMGFNLPLGKTSAASGHNFRVITCNIQNGTFDPAAFENLIKNNPPDIIALQECPRDFKLPLPDGWHVVQNGELAVMSHFPIRFWNRLQSMHPPHTWPRTTLLSCVLSVPGGDIAFCNVHLPSPRYGLQNILDRKTIINLSRKGLLVSETGHRLKTAVEVQHSIKLFDIPVIIAGDFNMPVESAIYRQVWGDYSNAFSKAGMGFGWTERAEIRGVPLAVRIDHILTDAGLIPKMCQVGPDIGSDHLPVIADVIRTVL